MIASKTLHVSLVTLFGATLLFIGLASALQVTNTYRLPIEFLSDFKGLVPAKNGAVALSGSPFKAIGGLTTIPGLLTSNSSSWPFNGAYARGVLVDSGTFVLANSVGSSGALIIDPTGLRVTVLKVPWKPKCSAYLVASDPKRNGLWVTACSTLYFVSGSKPSTFSVVSKDFFAGFSYGSKTWTLPPEIEPTVSVSGSTLYALAFSSGPKMAPETLIVAFTITENENGSPVSISPNPKVAPFAFDPFVPYAISRCNVKVPLFPQPDGNLLALVPLWPNVSETYYCNGKTQPSLGVIILSATLKQISSQVSPGRVAFANFGAVSLSDSNPNPNPKPQPNLKPNLNPNLFIIAGQTNLESLPSTTLSSLIYNGSNSSVVFNSNEVTLQMSAATNAPNKIVHVSGKRSAYVLLSSYVYEIAY